MKLRVLQSRWRPFIDGLRARADVETAGIILAERLHGETLLARELVAVPEAAYSIRQRDRLQIDPIGFNRLVRPARDRGLSVFTIHTHPNSDLPWFSAADDAGDSALMPSLFAQMDGPHGSLVIAGDTGIVCGRAWATPHEFVPMNVHEVGMALRVTLSGTDAGVESWFDRQRLALGVAGQRVLRNLHVAVVGLGGTGSVTFAQLVHLGVGQITIIDGDRAEATNISRIFGATTTDAGTSWKVDVAERYAANVGLGTLVNSLRAQLGRDIDPEVLAGCDVIFSCVDAHLPRALLNRLAYEKGILLFDMGSAFRVAESGVTAGAGRVVVVGPGRPCLACWGHIDANRIRIETLPPEEREKQAVEGYVSGIDVPQPSVVAFNTLVAGAAVVEFLRAVTEFAGGDKPPLRLSFDFATGTVRRNTLGGSSGCRICQTGLAPHEPEG